MDEAPPGNGSLDGPDLPRFQAVTMRPLAYILGSLVVLMMVLAASPAFADEASSAKADELKKRGNQAMLDLNYTEALDAYTAAITLSPDDATLYYNLGRAHQAREDYPAAVDALDQFERKASPEVKARVPKLDVLVSDVRSRVGAVAVRCTADLPNATITIGDKATTKGCSTSPKVVRISVPSRQAVVEVRLTADTHQGQTVRVAVEGGAAPIAVLLTVLPTSTSGMLFVRATPLTARISVDGTERGNPPLELPIGAGSHVLDVRAEGHDDKHLQIVVEAGKRRDVPVDLQRTTPITSRWWFWTGVGIIAVGVGITVWYLIAQPESDASTGSIAPGQVSAPLVRF